MIVIPSDFSEKVLEVNAVNAEKTTVTYKVNAAGNSQVENEANKVAKDIVSDLNSQLVDMYMVSILSNLYTAQKMWRQVTKFSQRILVLIVAICWTQL